MKHTKNGSHMVDLLFTLALFCVFAASALMVVLIGASVYKNTVQQMDDNFGGRTSITYVATKIRQNDTQNGVRMEEINGIPALVLDQEIDGLVYQTWIYHNDGELREVFTSADNPPQTADEGQIILEIDEFTIEHQDSSFMITSVDPSGRTTSQLITPRC